MGYLGHSPPQKVQTAASAPGFHQGLASRGTGLQLQRAIDTANRAGVGGGGRMDSSNRKHAITVLQSPLADGSHTSSSQEVLYSHIQARTRRRGPRTEYQQEKIGRHSPNLVLEV